MEIEEIVKLVRCLDNKQNNEMPFTIGKCYFIRTATMSQLGRLKKIVGKFLVLDDASWIADTGRFYDFLKDGKCNEYEEFPNDCIVPIDSIIDATEWTHKLFKGQK